VAVTPTPQPAPPPAAPKTVVERPTEPPATETTAGDNDELLRVARETVELLLDKMKIRATVTSNFAQPEDEQDKSPVLVDVRGDDLSILIGPKAETLNALQYITSLIVGKEIGRSAPLIVDVEGYRARRGQQIRQIARRMAEQAVRTGRRQALEPMPANERRLVHIELRNNPNVTTESVGEEPRRKVTIIPK
jgi:spoIIIJ-associated protein